MSIKTRSGTIFVVGSLLVVAIIFMAIFSLCNGYGAEPSILPENMIKIGEVITDDEYGYLSVEAYMDENEKIRFLSTMLTSADPPLQEAAPPYRSVGTIVSGDGAICIYVSIQNEALTYTIQRGEPGQFSSAG